MKRIIAIITFVLNYKDIDSLPGCILTGSVHKLFHSEDYIWQYRIPVSNFHIYLISRMEASI